MPALIAEATGVDLAREIAQWADGTRDLPLARLLAPFGVTMTRKRPVAGVSLGVRTAQRNGELVLTACLSGGAAQRAGLSAGDTIVAFDGLRASEAALKSLLARHGPGRRLTITAFRRDELRSFEVDPDPADPEPPVLRMAVQVPAAARRLRQGWLGATA